MPIKYKRSPAPEPKPADDRGYVKKYGPSVIRGGAGLFGFTPITGAISGGIGETLAQMVEQGSIDPQKLSGKRIAAETAVGAAMGKYAKALIGLVKGGKAGLAALKGGTYGAAAPIIRHGVEEGEMAPLSEVATSGAIGAVTGGGLARLMGGGPKGPTSVDPRKIVDKVPPPKNIIPFVLKKNYKGTAGLRVAFEDLNKVPFDDPTVTPDALAAHKALSEHIARDPGGPISKEVERLREITKAQAEAQESIGKTVVSKEKAFNQAMKERVDSAKAQETANKMVGKEKADAAKAQTKYVEGEQNREVKNLSAAEKFRRQVLAAADQAEAEDLRKTNARIAQSEAERQADAVEGLRVDLTEEVPPSSISETVTGPGERGGKARATFSRVAPKPVKTPKGTYSAEQQPPRETVALTQYTSLEKARKAADFYGGPEAGVDIEKAGNGYRVRFPDIESPPPTVPAPKGPKGGGGTKGPKGGGGAAAKSAQEAASTKFNEAIAAKTPDDIATAPLKPGSIEHAKANYSPEANAELDELGPKYRAAKGPEKRELGAKMAAIRKAEDARLAEVENLAEKKGTTLSAFGAGQAADIMEIARENPEYVAQLLGGLGGGLLGYNLDEDTPFTGALTGAILGTGGATALAKAPGAVKSITSGDQTVKEFLEPVISRIPNWQRAALLSDPRSIFHNSIAGPWGANLFGGLEQAIKGKVLGDPTQYEAGVAALKGASPGKWMKGWVEKLGEASEKIDEVEELGRAGQYLNPENPNIVDKLTKGPATYMLGGDLNTRKVLMDAGISEDLARRITLTAEPKRAIWRSLADWGKRGAGVEGTGKPSTIASLMLPFKRTAANIMESGTERTPVLGSIINMLGDASLKIPFKEQLVQEGIGGGVLALGYAAGAATSQDANKAFKVHSLVSNLGGQYALLANLGFMAGQAVKSGRLTPEVSMGNALRVLDYMGTGIAREMPLPSIDPLLQFKEPMARAARGDDISPVEELKKSSLFPKAIQFGEQEEKGDSGTITKFIRNFGDNPSATPRIMRRRPRGM